MIRGETVRCIVDYDLFDKNINGEEGCFVKLNEETGKSLIYFWVNEEWAELSANQFECPNNPGFVTDQNKEFVSHIKTLKFSLET
tara:strand:+ start:3128 stop:3382 length:255 start_codon:yes stop_codon:yes gene_type:complete